MTSGSKLDLIIKTMLYFESYPVFSLLFFPAIMISTPERTA